MGVFAQLERGMAVARLRRGRKAKKAAGGYAHGRPPYGYQAREGTLVEVPAEQAAINERDDSGVKDSPFRRIASRLESEGLFPRTRRPWQPAQVARLLDDGKPSSIDGHAPPSRSNQV